jgi:hypothetical protein
MAAELGERLIAAAAARERQRLGDGGGFARGSAEGGCPMTTLSLPQDAPALPYGPLVVGMPVITGETDKPCTRLVAIVSGFTAGNRPGRPIMNYLLDDAEFGACIGDPRMVTPLSAFGVAIEIDEAMKAFRCVEIPGADCTAVYRDGCPRWWQQSYADGMWWPYRPSVRAMLDRRWLA